MSEGTGNEKNNKNTMADGDGAIKETTAFTVSERFRAAQSLAPVESVAEYELLHRDVGVLGLFSSHNETAEDVSTGSLPLLSIECLWGMACLALPSKSAAERQTNVQKGMALLGTFLETLERLELLTAEQKKDMEEFVLNKDDDAADADRPRTVRLSMMSRDQKIARFKAKRDLEKRLEQLRSLRERRGRLGLDADQEMDGYDHESLERQLALQTLTLHASEALDEYVNALRELPMIEMQLQAEALRKDPRRGPREREEEDRRRRAAAMENRKPLKLTHITQDSATGQLNIRKEEIRAKVFQPHWNQPTMTLQELGEKEMREAMAREERQKQSEEEQKNAPRRYDQLVKDGMEDHAGLVDASAKLDRDWDDWKDENPRGSGNKMGDRGDRNF